jgi:hypothetical protein
MLAALAAVVIIVSFVFWRDAWFGRRLSDREIGQYLRDDQNPRRIQHALSQIADRIVQGDPTVEQWYPRTVALARHPKSQIRATAAWVMGQDNKSAEFHKTLLELLQDSELMVRRNAALELVRFGDESGQDEIVKMIKPYTVRASEPGTVSIHVKPGQAVGTGTLLARITQDQNRRIEVLSPLPGHVHGTMVQGGSSVKPTDQLVVIDPEADQVWEALRGLYLVGKPEDLPEVERYTVEVPDMPDRVRRQAQLTAEAIRTRAERSPIR